MEVLPSVVRFNANSDRFNLNCNRDLQNSKSKKDENAALGITQGAEGHCMITYHHLYESFCSLENLESAYKKARRGKTTKYYVIDFEKNLKEELLRLKQELEAKSYQPRSLKRFIIRDPKTRTIHASAFCDRVVYHALVNVLEPIYEKIFIYDSYASRKSKGTHKAVQRFDIFKRKISANGNLINKAMNANHVIGYVWKADIKHYFDTVDHRILVSIIRKKIKDEDILQIIHKILKNFDTKIEGKGMPLGNLTSQFFANIYLHELDQFVKHELKIKYYIRYVDDFVLLHRDKNRLEKYRGKINLFLREKLALELHSGKSKIIPISQGVSFLGVRIFYHHKLLRKVNRRKMKKTVENYKQLYREGKISYDQIYEYLQGWLAYAKQANTHKLRKKLLEDVETEFPNEVAALEVNRWLKISGQNEV